MSTNPTRPVEINSAYGETGAQTTPSNGALTAGQVALGLIGFKVWNWLHAWESNALRYLLRRGIPSWSSTETYAAGDIVSLGGVFYVALVPVLGTSPAANEFLSTRTWERWLFSPFGTDRSATDNSPIVRWRNAKSSPGNGVDRLGFLNGPQVQNHAEMWTGSESQAATGSTTFVNTVLRWAVAVTATGSGGCSISSPNSTYLARYADISIGTGASDITTVTSAESITRFNTGFDAAFEYEVATVANVDLMWPAVGIANNAAEIFGATNAFIGAVIYKANGGANWMCVTGDGTTLGTPIDSGVAVGTNRTYQMRIEWIGASMDMPVSGAASHVRFYIDGVLVGTSTANLPSSSAAPSLYQVFGVKRDTGASARGIKVLPGRFAARF